jgi:hypothetical protein
MVIILVKKAQLVIVVNDFDFGIKDVFETKVSNRYGTFNRIANKSMENMGHAYLYCNLLDKAIWTTIILKVKSPYINMHGQYLQKGMFVKVKNFNIESKSKR